MMKKLKKPSTITIEDIEKIKEAMDRMKAPRGIPSYLPPEYPLSGKKEKV